MNLNESTVMKDIEKSLKNDKEVLNRNGNVYSAGRNLYYMIKRTDKSPIIASSLDEAVEFKFGEDHQGGMIIFSTDINVTDGGIIQKIKNKLKTWFNRLTADRKLNKVSEKYSPQGWTVGKFLRGRYRARNGKLFDENSLSIEVIGLNSYELISMAEEICKEFEQETVLVKDYTTKDVMLVNSDKEIKESAPNHKEDLLAWIKTDSKHSKRNLACDAIYYYYYSDKDEWNVWKGKHDLYDQNMVGTKEEAERIESDVNEYMRDHAGEWNVIEDGDREAVEKFFNELCDFLDSKF